LPRATLRRLLTEAVRLVPQLREVGRLLTGQAATMELGHLPALADISLLPGGEPMVIRYRKAIRAQEEADEDQEMGDA
jgi:hypothetical protein